MSSASVSAASLPSRYSTLASESFTVGANASVEYLDGSDAALTDADANKTGFQADLGVGDTVIKVKVTAEDTSTTETYQVTVTRASSSDATLSDLELADASDDSSISLSPAFASDTTSYTARVANGVTRATIAPTVNASGASVEYLDGSDAALTDADANKTGFQADLGVGDTVIKVKVTAEDGTATETYQVTVTRAAPANNAATGKPGITGTPQRGGTLTATIGTIADDDGLTNQTFPGDYTFQWAKGGTDITGATSSTYDVPATETLGSTFTVKVSFTDDDGNAEGPLTSDATPGTVDAPEDCATDRADSDWCASMTVEVRSVGLITLYGYSTVSGVTYGSLDDTGIEYGGQTWPVSDVRFDDGGVADNYVVLLDAFVPRGSVFDLGGVELTTTATSEQSVVGWYQWPTDTNPGWIDGQKVTVSANLAPFVTAAAAVNGATLTLTFAEDLDTGSKPAASAFTVYIAGDTTGVNPSSVDTISGKTVTMTLATAVTNGQTVTLDYAVPTSNPLQDESGIDAPGFTGRTVTNNTPAACTDPQAIWCATLTVEEPKQVAGISLYFGVR